MSNAVSRKPQQQHHHPRSHASTSFSNGQIDAARQDPFAFIFCWIPLSIAHLLRPDQGAPTGSCFHQRKL